MRLAPLSALAGLALATAPPASGQQVAPSAQAASAQRFVQAFYRWYAQQPGYRAVLRQRPASVGGSLRRTLESAEACERRGDHLCLEADPLWNAQDFCPAYTADRATRTGGRYRVPLHGDCGHALVVEVVPAGRSWQIVRVQ